MEPAEQAVAGMRELLKSVSRSFYLTIRWLPAPMRHGVSLGYMLARATDSVADTSTAAPAERLRILDAMDRAVAGVASGDEVAALLRDLAGPMADAQEKASERALLQHFGECLDALRHTEPVQAGLIRDVLSTIIQGQGWDLTYFTPERTSVSTEEETRLYTYRVAGCVGEFWTRLGYATMGDGFCSTVPERRCLMEQAGVRYGCGLQLVNILRDRAEDAARGRRYLASDPEKWLGRAERYLRDGIDYCNRLRSFRLRFACLLPAIIGLKTLTLIRANMQVPKVKIPRRAVYASMLEAAFRALMLNRA